MIRICTSLSKKYEVSLWGRRQYEQAGVAQPFQQKRFKFLIKKGPLFYLEYNIRIAFKLLFSRFDVVHAVDLDTLPAAYLVSKLKGKQLVYDAHEYFTEVPELVGRERKKKMWLRIERFIVPKINYAITVSESIAQAYNKLYGVEFKVVRNCPELEDGSENTHVGTYILYQGALNKGRGLEATIEAMQYVDLPLKIAGKGDIEQELQELAKRLNLNDQIEFVGQFSKSDLRELTSKAFIGINVLENLGLSYYYSLSNKFFDYMHAGVPSLCSPFPEYEKIASEFACCAFANADAKEIADQIILLQNDTAHYTSLRKNAFLASQQLNWLKEEIVLLNLYDEVK
jgi:glycosyltransferase involved in cell wall biosynthesis